MRISKITVNNLAHPQRIERFYEMSKDQMQMKLIDRKSIRIEVQMMENPVNRSWADFFSIR